MSRLAKWATGRNVLALLAVFLLFNFVVISAFYPKFPTLDTLPSYTPEEAYQHLESYGSQGRQDYLFVELSLDTGGSSKAEASAAVCGDDSWSIESIEWKDICLN